jgi:tetratricopeptide (TPR) repeat protein
MKRVLVISLIVFLVSSSLAGQRANVLATYQFIENKKYTEAKEAIEPAVEDENTSEWFKTWHARGLLCQTAYEAGVEKNDKKKTELYTDQLYVAYESYEKCMELRGSDRMKEQIKPLYIILANHFMKLGEKEYKAKEYGEALKAYEYAMKINRSEMMELVQDTNLIYNAALAAYMGNDTVKAKEYLQTLCKMSYSPNVSHLLFNMELSKGDTLAAEAALQRGIDRFESDKTLVLLLVDLLHQQSKADEAIAVLDTAISKQGDLYDLYFTKGLVYQKSEKYHEAIEAYFYANRADSSKVEAYTNMGTCYFNIGVEIEVAARSISNNKAFQEEKAKAVAARKSAIKWLEQSYEMKPGNAEVREQLRQLYRILNMEDKLRLLD